MSADFTEFIRKKLSILNMSQRGFEREMGYKDGSFRAVLKNDQGPRLQDLDRMANILKLNDQERVTFRDLALKAHGYEDLANRYLDLHNRISAIERRRSDHYLDAEDKTMWGYWKSRFNGAPPKPTADELQYQRQMALRLELGKQEGMKKELNQIQISLEKLAAELGKIYKDIREFAPTRGFSNLWECMAGSPLLAFVCGTISARLETFTDRLRTLEHAHPHQGDIDIPAPLIGSYLETDLYGAEREVELARRHIAHAAFAVAKALELDNDLRLQASWIFRAKYVTIDARQLLRDMPRNEPYPRKPVG